MHYASIPTAFPRLRWVRIASDIQRKSLSLIPGQIAVRMDLDLDHGSLDLWPSGPQEETQFGSQIRFWKPAKLRDADWPNNELLSDWRPIAGAIPPEGLAGIRYFGRVLT